MRLRFLGIIPNTPDIDSPTIWLDEDSGDLLIQSYKATDKYEYDVTFPNVAAGELIRWLPRRKSADIPLPGTDLWMFDRSAVLFTYFSGVGEVVDREWRTEPAVVKLVSSAFEAVWERAIPHEEYKPL
ncbi:DUF6879 family protein [Streptomyces sp. Edi2]|uniref:DUF6879 family protein n=1 Tax=Streptomyces sp. Edi2 TaxID=3162528 RepID=UPI003305BCF4